MRFHYLVTIAIAISTSDVLSSVSPATDTVHDTAASVSRTLRARSIIDEERAGGAISSLFKSSKVTDKQLRKWLQKGKSAEEVFYRMNLAKTRTWIFDNPLFGKWVQYADDLSATASGKGKSAISTLTAQYGDDSLYTMLNAAKRDSSSKELASRLQSDQLERWITIKKDPSEVYKLYDLNHAGGRLLRNPQFNSWAKYVDDLHAKHGEGSMIPTLRKFNSDEDLFAMAEAAKSVDELKSAGLKLENAFVQFWVNDKQTPAKVLTELRLEATTKTLESPLLSLLAKYTDVYNVKFPQTKTTMIETFTHTFGDEKVAMMLKATDGKAKKIATELETAQVQMWLKHSKSVDDVYDLLDLPTRKLVNDLGTNPLFTTWIAYMNTFSVKNHDKMPQLISTMAMQFTDRPMMQLLQAMEKFPGMGSIATSLQLRKAEDIFTTGVSPVRAFKLTALDTVGDSVLSSPVFTKWMSYVDDFNRKNPTKEESWFVPLHANYEGSHLDKLIETARKTPKTVKIANMVESERMKEWLTMQKSPKLVFHFLKLDKAGDKTFSSPNFELWVKYLDDFNHKYPGEKTTMIESIRANYQDILLMPMLNEAAKVPSTKKLAKKLQNALTDKWVDEKVTATHLERMFGHMPTSTDWVQRYFEKLNKLS